MFGDSAARRLSSRHGKAFIRGLMAAAAFALLAATPANALTGSPPKSPSYVIVDDGPSVGSTYLAGDPLSPDGYVSELYIDQDTLSFNKGCGSRIAWGGMKFKTWPGLVTLFTYRLYVDFSWCNYKVTAVNQLWDEPVDTCCNWGWHGNISRYHSAVGGANMTVRTKGHFAACALFVVFCKDRYPWVQLVVNGNGLITGYTWGV